MKKCMDRSKWRLLCGFVFKRVARNRYLSIQRDHYCHHFENKKNMRKGRWWTATYLVTVCGNDNKKCWNKRTCIWVRHCPPSSPLPWSLHFLSFCLPPPEWRWLGPSRHPCPSCPLTSSTASSFHPPAGGRYHERILSCHVTAWLWKQVYDENHSCTYMHVKKDITENVWKRNERTSSSVCPRKCLAGYPLTASLNGMRHQPCTVTEMRLKYLLILFHKRSTQHWKANNSNTYYQCGYALQHHHHQPLRKTKKELIMEWRKRSNAAPLDGLIT